MIKLYMRQRSKLIHNNELASVTRTKCRKKAIADAIAAPEAPNLGIKNQLPTTFATKAKIAASRE